MQSRANTNCLEKLEFVRIKNTKEQAWYTTRISNAVYYIFTVKANEIRESRSEAEIWYTESGRML